MKIVKLTAENVKRLRAVEISPDGNVVVIAGRNGQGKSSILDSIWLALGGGPAAKGTTKPIRDGEDEARVVLDMGDLLVTRTWKGERTALRVESAEGATYPTPQAMLDALVGRLSFDPLAFAQQNERTQLASLLELVELPFDPDEMAATRKAIYDRRTEVGRTGKQLEGQLAGYPKPSANLPAEEISVADLARQHAEARQVHAKHEETKRYAEAVALDVERHRDEIRRLESELALVRENLSMAEAVGAKAAAGLAAAVLPDIDAIEHQLATAETTNAQVRQAKQRAEVAEQLKAAKAEYDALSKSIDALDETKAKAIAEAQMPIDGLAFDDDGVTYQGVPFKQSSSAEQLRVSIAMAMAMNPRIRVVRITDGSLLDSENMRLIEEMANEHDYQIWLERVDETGSVGIVIEDGAVAAVNGASQVAF